MKIVSDLFKSLKDPSFYQKQFQYEDGKSNVLFIDPVMSNFDFYSMIVPFLCLEQTNRFKTAITGIYRYSEIESKEVTKITVKELKWADVIVIPMSLESFSKENELFAEIRSIKPEIKIIQTVEFDFYEIKKDHYLLDDKDLEQLLKKHNTDNVEDNEIRKKVRESRDRLKEDMISRFEANLKSADRLITLNWNLQAKLQKKGFEDVEYVPILVAEDDFKENIDHMDTLGVKGTSGIVFMSCELNESTKSSFKEFVPYFKALREKHGVKFRLVIMGDHPSKYFPKFEIEVDHLSKGSIIHQFKSIVKSSADFHLILNKQNEYSSNSETLFSFVDRGLFGIPVASLSVSPLKEIIRNNSNGFILKKRADLVTVVNDLMKDKTRLLEMSKEIKNSVVNNSQINEEKVNALGEIFFRYTDPDAAE